LSRKTLSSGLSGMFTPLRGQVRGTCPTLLDYNYTARFVNDISLSSLIFPLSSLSSSPRVLFYPDCCIILLCRLY
jgi:hypothetical protein